MYPIWVASFQRRREHELECSFRHLDSSLEAMSSYFVKKNCAIKCWYLFKKHTTSKKLWLCEQDDLRKKSIKIHNADDMALQKKKCHLKCITATSRKINSSLMKNIRDKYRLNHSVCHIWPPCLSWRHWSRRRWAYELVA